MHFGSGHKWMLRLRDMEFKAKVGEENRLLERLEAPRRLVAVQEENTRLRDASERDRKRVRP